MSELYNTERFLGFGAPAISEAEIAASLRTGWLGTGPKVAQFESKLGAYKGTPQCAAVRSCTAALHLETHFGLAHLFETAGFEIIEIRPLTGFIVTFGQFVVYYNLRFARGRVLRALVRRINWAIQHLARALDRFDNSADYTCLYGLVARKPVAED